MVRKSKLPLRKGTRRYCLLKLQECRLHWGCGDRALGLNGEKEEISGKGRGQVLYHQGLGIVRWKKTSKIFTKAATASEARMPHTSL